MTGLGQVGALGRLGSPALNNGGGDIIRSIFADGTDGFYFDFSKTDRLFQNVALTAADGAGENIALALESHAWAGRNYAEQVAQQTELFTGSVGSATGWTLGSGWSISGGVVVAAAAVGTLAQYAISSQPAGFFRLELSIASRTAGDMILRLFNEGAANVTTNVTTYYSAAGTYVVIGYATGTWTRITLQGGGGGGFSGSVSGISVKAVSGNHGLQATTAAQPKWQTGGLARFDGSDDNLLTTLVPGTALTLAVKFNTSSATKILLGGGASAGDIRAYIGVSANGKASFGWGTDSLATAEYGADLRGGTHVMILTGSGATRELWVDGVQLTSGVSSGGSPNGGGALALGGWNNNGTLSNFAVGDIYYGLGIKKALPAATIAAITNLWGTS